MKSNTQRIPFLCARRSADPVRCFFLNHQQQVVKTNRSEEFKDLPDKRGCNVIRDVGDHLVRRRDESRPEIGLECVAPEDLQVFVQIAKVGKEGLQGPVYFHGKNHFGPSFEEPFCKDPFSCPDLKDRVFRADVPMVQNDPQDISVNQEILSDPRVGFMKFMRQR